MELHHHLLVLPFKAEYIHKLARQHIGIARVLYLHLAQHLADYHLNVLIGYLNALRTVNVLNLLEHIGLHALYALYLQYIVRVYGAVGQLIAGLYTVAALHLQLCAEGYKVFNGLAIVSGDYGFAPLAFAYLDLAANERYWSFIWPA